MRTATVTVFRERLLELIRHSGLTHSAFARVASIDRSTLSQLLSEKNSRLPRVDTVVSIAREHQVSVDWLLGISQEEKQTAGADILKIAIDSGVPAAEHRLAEWRTESLGYKIRYSPKTLPDLLKTEEVIEYEFSGFEDLKAEERVAALQQRLSYQRRPETDLEVCSSIQSLEGFGRGEGIWRALSKRSRLKQLENMIELVDELYPTFRWFLYDIRQSYCVPLTIFGPTRCAVYIGQMYFVFNSTEHIQALTSHFDSLIRVAAVQPNEVGEFLTGLLKLN